MHLGCKYPRLGDASLLNVDIGNKKPLDFKMSQYQPDPQHEEHFQKQDDEQDYSEAPW